MRTILSVYSTPGWANGGRGPRWTPNPFQYAAFMVALGKRYSGRFVQEGRLLPRVTHVEIWNEPNIRFFFRPQWRRAGGSWRPYSPTLYARLLSVTTPRLRRARPDLLVIAGVLGPTDTSRPNVSVGVGDFIRRLAARRPPIMAVSQHVSPGAAPERARGLPSPWGLPRIRRLWDRVRPGRPV